MVASMAIRTVIAEDNLLVREGVRRLLDLQTDIEIVAACGDLDALLAAVERERPDVIVTDIRMPPGGIDEGLRAADALRDLHPDIGVIVLSQYAEPEYALRLFNRGSDRRAYLLKERLEDVDQLCAAIHAVAGGGSMVDPLIIDVLVSGRLGGGPRRSTTSRRARATCCVRWPKARTTRRSRPRCFSRSTPWRR